MAGVLVFVSQVAITKLHGLVAYTAEAHCLSSGRCRSEIKAWAELVSYEDGHLLPCPRVVFPQCTHPWCPSVCPLRLD